MHQSPPAPPFPNGCKYRRSFILRLGDARTGASGGYKENSRRGARKNPYEWPKSKLLFERLALGQENHLRSTSGGGAAGRGRDIFEYQGIVPLSPGWWWYGDSALGRTTIYVDRRKDCNRGRQINSRRQNLGGILDGSLGCGTGGAWSRDKGTPSLSYERALNPVQRQGLGEQWLEDQSSER